MLQLIQHICLIGKNMFTLHSIALCSLIVRIIGSNLYVGRNSAIMIKNLKNYLSSEYMMLCAWKTKTKAGTAVLELLLIACTLCIHWDCIMLCWQKVLTLHGRSKQTAWHSNFIFILKKFCFFGRPSALILPFLPFPRRNFEKRKGSPSFFKFQENMDF